MMTEDKLKIKSTDQEGISDDVMFENDATLAVSRKKRLSGADLLDKYFLPAAILIAGLMISGSLIYSRNSVFGNDDNNADDKAGAPIVYKDVTADDDPALGPADAKVVVIEFSDFQCPFCRSFWRDTFPQIKETYIDTGKIRFVYRDYPLNFHPAAEPSALAGECAGDQGKFWEMHDKIFIEQEKQGPTTIQYGVSDLKKWASEIGLNPKAFNDCMDSKKYVKEVESDMKDGQAAGVSGTPGFFVNGRLIVGAQPFETFKQAIDAELNK